MTIAIRVDTGALTLTFDSLAIPCVIGKGGACEASGKQEGDGCTPRGIWPVRGALLRRGRVELHAPLHIPWRWTRACDGWSDDVDDPAYNRPVLLPHMFSHERLQRDDAAYDIVIVLGHNDAPPVPGMGSAIFWHIWVPDANGLPKATEGCVALAREEMDRLLPLLRQGMAMEIV